MAVLTEFVAAINQICSERGIDPESVYETLENAVLVAYKKETGLKEAECLDVELDRSTAEFKLICKKEIVKKVDDELSQISLTEAKKIDSKFKLGDFVEVEMPSQDLGRIAAQTAKQVILQNISELEKESVLKEFSGRVGEVFTALMQRMQRDRAVFEIGKATAYMPINEQIPGEFYRIGERYKVLLKEIGDATGSRELIVSRSDPDFLRALFEMEVPEINSGIIEIKAIAREAGSRSKIAVFSNQEGVDPIGSCVGQRGIRIANIMAELGEERIDIIEWDEDPEKFLENSLSPASTNSVKIEDGIAYVIVDEDQLSLAIGKDGQNVRLAAKLTGYKIDIQGPEGTKRVKADEEGEEVIEEESIEPVDKKKEDDEKAEEKKKVKKEVKKEDKKKVKKEEKKA
jgi:transcription termination/antitermination protein NusA